MYLPHLLIPMVPTSSTLLVTVHSLVILPNSYCIPFALFYFTFYLGVRAVCMYFTFATYVITPTMPKFLDYVMPLNESRALTFTVPAKYGDLDPNKYYFPIMLHADCISLFSVTTLVAVDSTYAVYVQHACGLFAALGDKLERLIEQDVDEELGQHDSEKEEITYRELVSCIEMHNNAIEFADMIESSQNVVFIFIIGLIVVCMSVAGYQMVMNTGKLNEEIRFTIYSIGHVAHIFYLSWPGQKLIDHSERIQKSAYGARWYDASARSKKLLLFMMLRSEEPCKLTAGKLYVMSLNNFSTIVKTSVSYFTVLTSFR